MAGRANNGCGYLYLRVLTDIQNKLKIYGIQPSARAVGGGGNLGTFHPGTTTYDGLDNRNLRPLDMASINGTRGTLEEMLKLFLTAIHPGMEGQRVSLYTVWFYPLLEHVYPEKEERCLEGTDAVTYCHPSIVVRDNVAFEDLQLANRYFFVNGQLANESILIINGTIPKISRVAARFSWLIRKLFFTVLPFDCFRTPFFYVPKRTEETPGVGRLVETEDDSVSEVDSDSDEATVAANPQRAHLPLSPSAKVGTARLKSSHYMEMHTQRKDGPLRSSAFPDYKKLKVTSLSFIEFRDFAYDLQDIRSSTLEPFLFALGEIYFRESSFGSLNH